MHSERLGGQVVVAPAAHRLRFELARQATGAFTAHPVRTGRSVPPGPPPELPGELAALVAVAAPAAGGSLGYARLPDGGAVVCQAEAAGRPSVEVLYLPGGPADLGRLWPIDLWRSPVWRDGGPEIAGQRFDVEPLVDFARQRRERLAPFLADVRALFTHPAGRQLVIAEHYPDAVAHWIALACATLDDAHARALTFTTHTRHPGDAPQQILGIGPDAEFDRENEDAVRHLYRVHDGLGGPGSEPRTDAWADWAEWAASSWLNGTPPNAAPPATARTAATPTPAPRRGPVPDPGASPPPQTPEQTPEGDPAPVPDPVPDPPDPVPRPAPDPVPDPVPDPAPDPVPDPVPDSSAEPAREPAPAPGPDPGGAAAPQPGPEPVPAVPPLPPALPPSAAPRPPSPPTPLAQQAALWRGGPHHLSGAALYRQLAGRYEDGHPPDAEQLSLLRSEVWAQGDPDLAGALEIARHCPPRLVIEARLRGPLIGRMAHAEEIDDTRVELARLLLAHAEYDLNSIERDIAELLVSGHDATSATLRGSDAQRRLRQLLERQDLTVPRTLREWAEHRLAAAW